MAASAFQCAMSAMLNSAPVRERCGASGPNNYVFYRLWPKIDPTSPMGIGGWRSAWRSVRKAAGFPKLRYYDLRHQFVTELCEAGVPEGVIRELAGHIDPAMTRWYAHPRMAARRAAVEKLSTVSGPVTEGGYDTNNVTTGRNGDSEAELNARKNWRARRDSNSRPIAPEAIALSS